MILKRQILASRGHPLKVSDQVRKALVVKEATKGPRVALKKLDGSTAQMGEAVYRITTDQTLHKAGLFMEEW